MRPERIETPAAGQESVWDTPRPPAVEPVAPRIRVEFGGIVLAESTRALRVVETAGPPVYDLPPGDVAIAHLEPSSRTAWCETPGSPV